ncbi:MAG TPA: DMT family transporter [Verrucomicrobiae bacterium]|nr:DMT family transporter [Verrucomicrobiae bacterium]
MGAIMGLAGAVCWGFADFAARFASRRVGAYRTLLYMQFFGCLALTAYLLARGGFHQGIGPGWRPWGMAVAAGLVNMASSLALYRSFEVGTMSIVAPVSSCYPALTAVLSFESGERIGVLKAVGLGVTLVGVILAGTSFGGGKEGAANPDGTSVRVTAAKGLLWAILAAIGFGFLFWFLGFYVVPAVGSTMSVWVMRSTAIVGLFLLAAPTQQSVGLPHGTVWWLLMAVGFLDTSAFVMNNAGLRIGPVSVVSVLASLYGAVTVLLSWIFLREKLEWSQWLGIAVLFCGIAAVNL